VICYLIDIESSFTIHFCHCFQVHRFQVLFHYPVFLVLLVFPVHLFHHHLCKIISNSLFKYKKYFSILVHHFFLHFFLQFFHHFFHLLHQFRMFQIFLSLYIHVCLFYVFIDHQFFHHRFFHHFFHRFFHLLFHLFQYHLVVHYFHLFQ
jgi:hypothetical protein